MAEELGDIVLLFTYLVGKQLGLVRLFVASLLLLTSYKHFLLSWITPLPKRWEYIIAYRMSLRPDFLRLCTATGDIAKL
jgi:hypothetical protein